MVTSVTSFSRNGLSDWLVQRASAVILLAYAVFIAGYLICTPELDYAQWRTLFDSTCVKIFSLLAILSLCAHAWVGLWAISNDYLTERLMGAKATPLRLGFQTACCLIIFVYLVWGAEILWG